MVPESIPSKTAKIIQFPTFMTMHSWATSGIREQVVGSRCAAAAKRAPAFRLMPSAARAARRSGNWKRHSNAGRAERSVMRRLFT